MQYFYSDENDAKRYHHSCEKRILPENYTQKDLVDFVENNYGDTYFNGPSPYRHSEDYIKKQESDICNPTDFILQPHQKFLGQWLNPKTNIKNLLLWHGLGSGKTCTSLVMSQANTIMQKTDPVILLVVPKALIAQYKKEIRGNLIGSKVVSCTGGCIIKGKRKNLELDEYMEAKSSLENQLKRIRESEPPDQEALLYTMKQLEELQDPASDIILENHKYTKARKRKSRQVYHLISHGSFINKLLRQNKHNKQLLQDNWLNPEFKSSLLAGKSLLVIDEAHKLVSKSGIQYRKLLYSIQYYIHPDTKILLLTGTPIYDNPIEFGLAMNLLRPRIPFPTEIEKFKTVFMNEDGSLKNKEVFQYMCSGYLSYFRGGNPRAYPEVNVYYRYHTMSENQLSVYTNELSNELKAQSENFNDPSDMKSFYSKFLNIISTDIQQSENFSGMFIRLRQISNIAFPRPGVTPMDVDLNSMTGEEFYENKVDSQRIKEFKDILMSDPMQFWNSLYNYSQKFSSIIQSTISSEGTVFIFSEFKDYAIRPLEAILQCLGYREYFKKTADSSNYFLWTGDTNSDKIKLDEVSSVFNSPDNIDGSKIKVIIGSLAIMEGVDFKNINQVHICEPWWNEPRMQQVMARAIRWCSHSSSPNKSVEIYRHYSVFSGVLNINDPNSRALASIKKMDVNSIDQVIKSVAMKKLKIKETFETAAKEVAIDCNLFRFGNLVRLEKHIDELEQKEYFVDPGNRLLEYQISRDMGEQGREYTAVDENGNQVSMVLPPGDIKMENVDCKNSSTLWLDIAFEDEESRDIIENLRQNTDIINQILPWNGYMGGIYNLQENKINFINAIESIYSQKDTEDSFRKAVDSLISKENRQEEKSEKTLMKYVEQGLISEADVNKFIAKNYTYTDILTLVEKNK